MTMMMMICLMLIKWTKKKTMCKLMASFFFLSFFNRSIVIFWPRFFSHFDIQNFLFYIWYMCDDDDDANIHRLECLYTHLMMLWFVFFSIFLSIYLWRWFFLRSIYLENWSLLGSRSIDDNLMWCLCLPFFPIHFWKEI